MKSLVLLLALGITNPTGAQDLNILGTTVFERTPNSYAAFPAIYRDVSGKIILKYVARFQKSHINSTGTEFVFSTTNCGTSWEKAERAAPPDVQHIGSKDEYRFIAAEGWKKTQPGNTKSEVTSRSEGSSSYSATGAYIATSNDGGLSWKKKPVSVQDHAAMMNYHIGSQLKTRSGRYLVAVYFKRSTLEQDQVMIISTKNQDSPEIAYIPKLTNGSNVGGNETSLVQLNDGRIAAFIRPDPDKLNKLLLSISKDDGLTWSEPTETDIAGYPPQALNNGSEIILSTAQRRTLPLKVLIYKLDPITLDIRSKNALSEEYSIQASDFGYPITVQCKDVYLTAYYRPSPDGGAEVVIDRWR